MPERVNTGAPKRSYVSPRRQDQAQATRRQILQAAHRLFVTNGYPGTTIAAIAAEAGVALKTVYLAFETKSGVVRALWDVLLRGEDDVPVADLDWYRQLLAEPDPHQKLKLVAQNSTRVKTRIGDLLRVIRSAAPVDPDVAALWQLIQADFYQNQRAIIETLHQNQALKAGLDVTVATDILWTLNHPDIWHLLVDRGWTPAQFERWFADTLRAQLLP